MAAIRHLFQGHPTSKVIDLGTNRKRACNLLLVISSNFSSYGLSAVPTVVITLGTLFPGVLAGNDP